MNVVPAVPPGRGRRDRELAVPPAGEEQMGALRAAAASAITALPEIAFPGIALPTTDLTGIGLGVVASTATGSVTTAPVKTALVTIASVTTVQGPIDRGPTVRRQIQGQTVPVQTVFRLVDRAINDSDGIVLHPSAAGMVKSRDPMTGDVPVVPMTSVPVEMIDPPRGTAPAVFVRTVPLIDVVQEMNGVSHPRDSVSTHHRAIVIIPLHVE